MIEPDAVSQTQATLRDVRFSDLMEDLVGFGARTFRSIKAAFTRPRTYFQAAKSPDWTGRFSPSVRIYLGLITVSAFFRFLYAGEAGAMTTLYEGIFENIFDQVEAQGNERPTASTRDLAMETLRYYFLLSPFIALPIFMLIGWIFRGFGEPLNTIVRIRYVFATLVPATVVMTLLTIGFVILPREWFSTLSLMTMLLTLVIMGVTTYFGAFSAKLSKKGRIGRCIGFTTLMFIAMMLSAIIAINLGIVLAFRNAAQAGLL